MKVFAYGVAIGLLLFFVAQAQKPNQPINRQAVVARHSPVITRVDTLASLSVGNGKFAFTTDVTGLQTFPEYYQNGIPLGTQSEWGWHSWPNSEKYALDEAYKDMPSHGRMVPYAVQISTPERRKNAVNYLRQNPHRLQLGNIGFEILKKDGSFAQPNDLQHIRQSLNLWTGEISSYFTVGDVPVEVVTLAHPTDDVVAVKVNSELLKTGQLKIKVRFPYPTNEFLDNSET